MGKIEFVCKDLSSDLLRTLYERMLWPRLIEERMLRLLRQGKLSKWFSGIGQEAVAVGAASAMREGEYILPMHRNLGVFTTRGVPLDRLFAQFLGRANGFTKGRDRSFHFGTREHYIVGMISHLGAQLPLAAGIGLAHRLRGEGRAVLVFTGDGGTSEGDFHEALNLASVWGLPVIFLIENNGYAISTPTSEQYACRSLVDRADGYGMEGVQIDGNNILTVYRTVSYWAEYVRRESRPVLIECMTFRMRGHEEASGIDYVPKRLLDYWRERDPLYNYESYLLEKGVLEAGEVERLRAEVEGEIGRYWELAWGSPRVEASSRREEAEVYAPFGGGDLGEPVLEGVRELRFIEAISEALRLMMRRDLRVILMGQDIAEYGGVFKVTKGFVEEFGKARVRNTPVCESGVIGLALGLAVEGFKPVVEMQFGDFVSCGFNQIVNNLAKIHYRWGQSGDVVIRLPAGAGVGAGPFHSQTNEAWFFHVPGLKIAYPSTPFDAKGLLCTAIEDPNPVLFFEHKVLYRGVRGEVPEGVYGLPFGRLRRVRQGEEITLITYGMGVHWAEEVLSRHSELSVDLLDLRTLVPWDREGVLESVRRTGKVLILHEDTLCGGVGAEISAYLAEHAFSDLDAPIVRVGSLETPVPMAPELERDFLASARLERALLELWEY